MAAPNWVAAGKQASWLLSHFYDWFCEFCGFCDKKENYGYISCRTVAERG